MKTELSFIASLAVICTASFAADAGYPRTLAELNSWYTQPPPGQNAASNYLVAFAELTITDANTSSTNLPLIDKGNLPLPDEPISQPMKEAIADFVERNQPALTLLHEAAEFDQCRYPTDLSRGEFTLLPHLPKIRSAALVLELSAVSHALVGDGKLAGEDALAAFALGRSLESEPNLISQLVRFTCVVITVNGLEQVLNRVAVPAETLNQLQIAVGKLEEKEASGSGFTRAYVCERLSYRAVFDEPPELLLKIPRDAISEDRQFPEDFLAQIKELKAKPLPEIRAIIAEDRRLFETTFDQVMAARTNPFPARLKELDIFSNAATDATNKNCILSSMFLPALPNVAPKEAIGLAMLRLAQTAIALERFRAAHEDRYAETIKELTPEHMVAVPMDPFDGKPLRYRKAGNGYILYSIGRDLKDDSGKRGKWSDGDLVFSVVNPPRPSQ